MDAIVDNLHCRRLQITPEHDDIYQLWRAAIIRGMQSEGLVTESEALSSDDFLRQHTAICLYHNDKPISLLTMTRHNLNFTPIRDLSYFKNYPFDIVNMLREDGHTHIFEMAHLVADQQYRRSVTGFPMTEIVMGLAMQHYLESDCTALISYTRMNRGTHELCYRYGAEAISDVFVSYGIDSNAVAFYRNKVTTSSISGIPALVERLWKEKKDG